MFRASASQRRGCRRASRYPVLDSQLVIIINMILPNDVEEGDFSMMEGCSVNTNSLVRWEFARAVQTEDKDKVQAFDLARR